MTGLLNFELFKQVIFYSLSASLVFCPAISYAQIPPQNNIVVDQNAHLGGQNPFFEQSQNNTDVLNIVAPTSGGVSHNKFIEYNVNEQGLIVNNLTFQTGVGQAESQIGGTVAYNKNLGLGDAARVILNEVTSNSTSSLKGYTEIFGARAALIIANPNGITCEGCGFLNTSKLTLTTGRPNMENGNIKDFSMNTTGIIEILGAGGYNVGLHVDGSPAQIVSNSVKIAGLILVDDDQQLDIMTGNDKFDYNNSTITSDNTSSVGVAVDSSALGGMYAGRIKIHATQKGFGVNTEGNLVASMDNVEITADGDIVYKNIAANKNVKVISEQGKVTAKENGATFAGEEIVLASLNNDVELKGEYVYGKNVAIGAGQDIINKSQIFADNQLVVSAGRDFDNHGDAASMVDAEINSGRNTINQTTGSIIAGNALGLYSLNDVMNYGNISSGVLTEIMALNDIANEGKISSQFLVNLYAGNNLLNKGEITSGSVLYLEAVNKFENQNKLNSVDYLGLKANDIHNYGQIASNGDIEIETGNDFINYRDSAVLAGGSILFTVTRNFINYMAEIFAIGDITFTGATGATEAVDTSVEYDNPYVTDTRTYDGSGNGYQNTQTGEEETFEPLEIYLTDLDITIYLPVDAFGSDPQPGDSYTFPDGSYTITLGADIDDLIITDEFDVVVNYSLFDDTEEVGDTITTSSGDAQNENSNLGPFANSSAFVPEPDAMNSLQNIGGRIESFSNININADKLYNIGKDYNTGLDGYDVSYYALWAAYPGWNKGTLEMGRYKITATHFTSVAGLILAGNDLNISSREILNQSSTLSAKNNVFIKTDNLTNQTSSYLATLAIQYEARKKSKNASGRTSKKIWQSTGYYQERVYSKVFSLITAGASLVIDATGGSVTNDQVENAITNFFFGRDNAPDIMSNLISVNVNLPNGTNGLFVVGHDPKYLVTSNVTFLDAGNFAGSDYFFDRITPISNEFNTRKIIGDAAYETRLVMDALRQATGGHYLGNGEIGSDLEQMKAFYANAADEMEKLNLMVGIALTEEQMAALTSDIIWYVEKEINGELVLVPEIYLCDTTKMQIAAGDHDGAKMVGGNVAISADNLSNSGDIFAKNNLFIQADYLNNESNWLNQARIIGGNSTTIEADLLKNSSGLIGGGVTQITAENLINETKVYSEEVDFGKNYTLIEKTGQIAVIYGDNGVNIDVENTLINKGANIESANGNISISANTAIFDTVELHNRTERFEQSKGFMSKKSKTTIEDSVTNVGSNVIAAGNVIIKTEEDTTLRGSTVAAGDSALFDVGGNLNVLAAKDSDYSYVNTKKSSWGGLKSSKDTVSDSSESLVSSQILTGNDLTIVSGKNTNIVGSNVTTGGDANIYTGYQINDDGSLSKSGEEGSLNVLNDYITNSHFEEHIKKDYTKVLSEIGLSMVTGGASMWRNVEFTEGKLTTSVDLGEASKNKQNLSENIVVGSELNIGGNLNITSANDVNIRASDLYAGNDINMFADGNINMTSAANTIDEKTESEKSKISTSATVGNAYVDVGYAAKHLVEALEAQKKAADNLKYMKELQSQGKASSEAVKDAELNLAMAAANVANATIALTGSAAGAATAASSSFGTGMYASGGIDYETSKTTTTQNTVERTQSNIISDNGSINLKSANDINQEGTNIYALNGTLSYDVGNNLTIESSQDTYKMDTKTEHMNAGATVGNNAVQVNFGMGESSGKIRSTTNQNSEVLAQDIVIKTGNDALISGVNMEAGTISMDIGNDLTVESRQDTYYAKNSSQSMNVSIGTNGGGGGFSTGSGNTDSAWVYNQTSIIGNDSVDIKVGSKTTVTGAVIASGEYDEDGKFQDAGNLRLETAELEYSDIKDFYKDESSSFGFQTNIGQSTNKQTSTEHTSGTTTISISDTGSEKEQLTKATIGEGTIIVGGEEQTELAGLNRDVNNSQEITKDMITGALDGSVTIDNRLLDIVNISTDANGNLTASLDFQGYTDIANDFSNFDKNVIKGSAGAFGTVSGTTGVIADVILGDTALGDAVDSWKANQSGMATGIGRAGNDYVSEVLEKVREGTATPEEIQNVLKITGFEGEYNLVYTDKGEIALIDGENRLVNGFNDQLEKQGYVNLANGAATNADTLLRTDAEERAHNYTADEDLAKNAANNELAYYNFVAQWTGGTTTNASEYGVINKTQYTWNQQYTTETSQLLANNTYKASQVADQDKVYAKGASIVAGAGSAMSYHGMAELLGDGDPIKGHQIIQSDPKYRAIADSVNNTLSTVSEATTPVLDAIGGAPARIVGGIKAGMGGEITQSDIDAMNPISYGSEKSVEWIQQKIDENVDNPEMADYYKYLLALAATTTVVAETGNIVKGGVSKTMNATEKSASTPVGGKGKNLNIVTNNKPTTINNIQYSGHAIDNMQSQGIMPSVVENAMKSSNKITGKISGTTVYHDTVNNITVVTSSKSGKIITVDRGIIKQ